MQDSSFKVAAAIFGIGALLKISAFAIAIAMLGLASSVQVGSRGSPCMSKLAKACGETYALDKSDSGVERFIGPIDGAVVEKL